MTKCTVTLHPRGLDPFQSSKAWFLRKKSKLPWKDVRKQVRTANGQLPGQRALENAVRTVAAHKRGEKLNYFQKLVAGMPRCLAKCKANEFGSFGK